MTTLSDPILQQTLDALGAAERQLADAAERLAATVPIALRLADDTDWRTEAAVRFHAAAEAWQADVRTLAALTEAARDDVRRLGDRMGILALGYGA